MKKLVSIIMVVCMLSVATSVGAVTLPKDEELCGITSVDITQNDIDDAVEAQYIGEQDGAKMYKVVIPIVWHSYNASEKQVTRAANDCDCVIYYWGNGVWEYNLTFMGLDLIKYLNGNLSTYGVGGSTSRVLEESNFIPGPIINVNEEFHYLHPVNSGYQYFKVSGTVTGVNGYGSFGPQTNSLYVTVE